MLRELPAGHQLRWTGEKNSGSLRFIRSAPRFKKRQRVAILGPYHRNPSNLPEPKSSALASRKSPYSKTQSDNRNLMWSDVPSSLPTIRCGGTRSPMETRIVPVTLATDTEGVTKVASTGVRSSAYLLSRDSASSSVTFIGCESRQAYVYAAFFCCAFTFAQRAFCAAAIFLRLAAEIVRFSLIV